MCLLAVLLLLTQVNCGTTSVDFPQLVGCDINDEGTLEISSGPGSFEAVADGGPVMITAGFQGGYHVYATLRTPVSLENPVHISMNVCQGETVVARNRVESDFRANSSFYQSENHLIYVLHDFRPEQLDGQSSKIAVRLVDAIGTRTEAVIDVVTECCEELQ